MQSVNILVASGMINRGEVFSSFRWRATMVPLPAQFDNAAAAVFFDILRDVPINESVTLDAAETLRVSTLGIQVLLSFENSLQQQGHRLMVRNMSKDVQDMFNDVGLADVVKRWSAP